MAHGTAAGGAAQGPGTVHEDVAQAGKAFDVLVIPVNVVQPLGDCRDVHLLRPSGEYQADHQGRQSGAGGKSDDRYAKAIACADEADQGAGAQPGGDQSAGHGQGAQIPSRGDIVVRGNDFLAGPVSYQGGNNNKTNKINPVVHALPSFLFGLP